MDVQKSSLKKYRDVLSNCFKTYCRMSNVHGLRHIAAEDNKLLESCFWFVTSVSCIVMTLVMVSTVWTRFQETPTMTTIASNNHPISEVPFPAITICNLNKILQSSATRMINIFKAHGINESDMTQFIKNLPQIYARRSINIRNEEEITKVMDKLGYDLEKMMFELSQPCARLLVRCMWLGKDYNCSNMFVDIKTPEGFCCSFNWHGSVFDGYQNLDIRKKYETRKSSIHRDEVFEKELYVNEASIPTAGLTVVMDSEEQNYFASVDSFFGSAILLHEPFQYPEVYVPKAFVQPKYEMVIRLRPTVIESSKTVRQLPVNRRQCYFEDEFVLGSRKKYSSHQCTLDCKLNDLKRTCGCVPFFYPNLTSARTCTLADRKCLLSNQGLFSGSESKSDANCTCLASCSSVAYDWVALGNKIYYQRYASPIFKGNLGNRSVVFVFFEDNVCMKYRKDSLITWDSVVASFGGIFGLCLGGSIVSLIEFFHYFTYQYWKRELTEKKEYSQAVFIRRYEKDFAKVQPSLNQNNFLEFNMTKRSPPNKLFSINN